MLLVIMGVKNGPILLNHVGGEIIFSDIQYVGTHIKDKGGDGVH